MGHARRMFFGMTTKGDERPRGLGRETDVFIVLGSTTSQFDLNTPVIRHPFNVRKGMRTTFIQRLPRLQKLYLCAFHYYFKRCLAPSALAMTSEVSCTVCPGEAVPTNG